MVNVSGYILFSVVNLNLNVCWYTLHKKYVYSLRILPHHYSCSSLAFKSPKRN